MQALCHVQDICKSILRWQLRLATGVCNRTCMQHTTYMQHSKAYGVQCNTHRSVDSICSGRVCCSFRQILVGERICRSLGFMCVVVLPKRSHVSDEVFKSANSNSGNDALSVTLFSCNRWFLPLQTVSARQSGSAVASCYTKYPACMQTLLI